MLTEGVKDKAALKFIFLAGGAGSGKTHTANKLFGIDPDVSFSKDGLKMVSFDKIFEKMLEHEGYPKDLNQIPSESLGRVMSSHPNSVRSRARTVMKRQMSNMAKNQTGMIFDGTGQSAWTYIDRKQEMEELGYDVYLVFVDTDLNTALERNAKRERKLPDSEIKKIWHSVSSNKNTFKKYFGNNMVVVNNNTDAPVDLALQPTIDQFVNEPIKNRIGKQLLKNKNNPSRLQNIIGSERVHNPITGNNIKLKSAMAYPKSHPARKAAMYKTGKYTWPKTSTGSIPLSTPPAHHKSDTQSYFDLWDAHIANDKAKKSPF